MKMISTSAYKVRLMDSSGGKEAIEYLRTIREDRLFREYYSF